MNAARAGARWVSVGSSTRTGSARFHTQALVVLAAS